MRFAPELLEHNQRWARHLHDTDPTYFDRQAAEQPPNYLWMRCADSRVPPNLVVDLEPQQAGPLGMWIDQVAAIGRRHVAELKQLEPEQRLRRPCELNAPAQVHTLAKTEIINRAWDRQQPVYLHGWIYDLHTGLLNDLGVDVEREVL